ncbi:HAD hydrolase-like protein [Desulfurispira natronophila]|uniref:phosphoglycolate phosphatase n=1 Tax=Desulfurispira natronophila TaxID=682562 RepID=A0A7W7Y4A2_9BACT|nr:phosphoglycolate phosphatase [Desulfurispira natronophila]
MAAADKPVVLFDLDGTLIDSTDAIVESFGTAFRVHGRHPLPASSVVALIGHPLTEMFRRLGIDEHHVNSFVAAYKQHYRSIARQKTTLLPYGILALQQVKAFARMGVVTTKTGRYSIEILQHLQVLGYFETVVGFEDVVCVKPHPEPILTALKRMQVMPGPEVYMIGDTSMDVESAVAACVTPLAVTSGYETAESLQRHGCAVFEHCLQACAHITRTHVREPTMID